MSGIAKVHAIVGGFHLVPPKTVARAREIEALMQAINPDVIIPGHCSGETFIAAAQAAMPGKVYGSDRRHAISVRPKLRRFRCAISLLLLCCF